jgi:hypothetical protein
MVNMVHQTVIRLKKIENKVKTLFKNCKEFDDNVRRKNSPSFSKAPHIYRLVKIHQHNYPLRSIVSCIDSPGYHLAKYLVLILNPLVGKTSSL